MHAVRIENPCFCVWSCLLLGPLQPSQADRLVSELSSPAQTAKNTPPLPKQQNQQDALSPARPKRETPPAQTAKKHACHPNNAIWAGGCFVFTCLILSLRQAPVFFLLKITSSAVETWGEGAGSRVFVLAVWAVAYFLLFGLRRGPAQTGKQTKQNTPPPKQQKQQPKNPNNKTDQTTQKEILLPVRIVATMRASCQTRTRAQHYRPPSYITRAPFVPAYPLFNPRQHEGLYII